MTHAEFKKRTQSAFAQQEKILKRRNPKVAAGNGIYERYTYPVLTAEHAPLIWRYDFDQKTNPYLQERLGINAVFNAGAIEHDGKILVIGRVEGVDRKSFLAVAESPNGVDNFRFWDYPILLPQTDSRDVNVYDIRVVRHEDGWIYGLFCTERKDPKAPAWDTSSAVAQCGIVRTKEALIRDQTQTNPKNVPAQCRSPLQSNVRSRSTMSAHGFWVYLWRLS